MLTSMMALAFVVLTCFLLQNSNANPKQDETMQALLERLQKLEELSQQQIRTLQEQVTRQEETINRLKENNFLQRERIVKLEKLNQQRQKEIRTLQENVNRQEETINRQEENNLMQEKRALKLEEMVQQRLIDIWIFQEKSKSKAMQDGILETKTAQNLSQWNRPDAATTIRKRSEINGGFTTPVAFSAGLTNDMLDVSDGHLIKMTDIKLNERNGYNVNDGIFFCPRSGLYLFHWSAMPPPAKELRLKLMVNGVFHSSIYAYSQPGYQMSSNLALVRLNAGDHVFVESAGSTSSFYSAYCSFSGVRMSD